MTCAGEGCCGPAGQLVAVEQDHAAEPGLGERRPEPRRCVERRAAEPDDQEPAICWRSGRTVALGVGAGAGVGAGLGAVSVAPGALGVGVGDAVGDAGDAEGTAGLQAAKAAAPIPRSRHGGRPGA